jgi:predicted membrane protein
MAALAYPYQRPVCIHCQAPMFPTKRRESNIAMQILGIAVFFLGVLLCFSLMGALVGIPLIFLSARMGFKKYPVMQCSCCRYHYKV